MTGCTNVSPGCKHCYARVMAERLKAMDMAGYENGFAVTLQPNRLSEPLRRRAPTMYFVNSMSDLFHELVPFDFVERIFDVIARTAHHQYQILTKRPKRMVSFFKSRTAPPNVWLGVSVENRKHGLPRVDSNGDPSSGSSAAAAPSGSDSAAEVGKAIVEMDEKHAGDSMWLSSAATAEMCDNGSRSTDSLPMPRRLSRATRRRPGRGPRPARSVGFA